MGDEWYWEFPDEEFGDTDSWYCIVQYTDGPPPYPKDRVVQTHILGFEEAQRQLAGSNGDLMLCLESEIA